MKKHLLFAVALIGITTLNAQTITKENLKWDVGNFWINLNNSFDTTSISTVGTGQVWDFSTITTGQDDTVNVTESTTYDVNAGSDNTIFTEYNTSTSSYSYATIGGVTIDDPSALDIGLPHSYNNNYSSASTVGGFFPVTLNGSVPASGAVKLKSGTFNCILVMEKFSGAVSQTNLYWETVEHGRVAIFSQGKIGVMQSTNLTVSAVKIESNTAFSIFPNPASSSLTIKSGTTNATVTVLNTLGVVVNEFNHNGGQVTIDVSSLSKGLYFIHLQSSTGFKTRSMVVE
jgi:hypothetical protein